MARRGLTGGSVLDVGCGFGYFLQEAASCFDFRAGTELSPAAAAEARGRADEIFVGGINAVPDNRRFDCITALHVIEHIYRPDAFLQKVLRHLRNDGVLVLAAPDMGSLWRKAMGRRWPSFKYPEHVVFYDANSLASLMRRAGLRDIERLPYPHAFPVADVCKKLGLPAIGAFRSRNIWFPATTVAFAGRISDRASS
jgi:SAM-dependent methyltransferase